MKRRSFIQRLAGTGIVLPIALGFPRVRAFAKSPASPFARLASASTDNILIIIRLAGGNDGLNTVIPYTNSDYYTARRQGTDDNLSIATGDVLTVSDSGTMGFHPAFQPLIDIYNEKKMAVVQSVGYQNQNLSHFRSTDIWLSGSDWNVFDNAGWYAKYLESLYPDYPDVLPPNPFAIELGTSLSTTLIGNNQNMGIAVANLDHVPDLPGTDPLANTNAGIEEEYVRQIARQTNIFANSIIDAVQLVTENKVTFPESPLGQGLAAISRLIAAGMTTQMYIVNVGGYDTHTGQLDIHNTLLSDLAASVAAFQRDTEAFDTDDKVAVMTISEFGRRVESNGTGTDHGSAAPMFFFGTNVNGGFYGSDPNLNDLEGPGNLKMQYDFRQLYASVLGQWYGAGDDEIYPAALPHQFDQLPIFKVAATGVDVLAATSSFQLGQNYPNPARAITTIPVAGIIPGTETTLSVYTMEGREILSRRVTPGENALEIDVRQFPEGSYIYSLTSGAMRRSQRMSVVR